jgi:hypothetical protein
VNTMKTASATASVRPVRANSDNARPTLTR